MSSATLILKAKKRDLEGKKPNALRAEGNVPAVIHDHGKDSHHIVVDEPELVKIYRAAGMHHTVDVDVEGKKFTTLIKEVTHRPGSAKVYHSVFQAIKANETVTAQIPVKLAGEIPAERANLLIVNGVDSVEVEALPKDLVDVIEVDATVLTEAGDKLTVADLVAPSGMTIKTDSEQLVAAVEMPRDQIAEADEALKEQEEADATSVSEADEEAPAAEATEEE